MNEAALVYNKLLRWTMRYGFNSRHVNSIISGIFTAFSQNSIIKDNEQKLVSIEELFGKIVNCETKKEIELILGEGKIDKVLKDSYVVSYCNNNIVKFASSEANFNLYAGRTYKRNQKITINVKYDKQNDEVVEISKVGF